MDKTIMKQTVEIRGKEYGEADLWNYLEDHKAEFTEPAVLKEITEALAEQEEFSSDRKINCEFTVVEDNPFLFHGRKDIYQGNALFMAIYLKEYELARKLIGQQTSIKDGSCVPVYRMENAEPLIGHGRSINLLTVLLEDERMPEDIWMRVWGYYSKKYSMALQVFQASQAKIKLWMSTLKKIKANRPQFFEKIVNERFMLELLWCYAIGYKWESRKDVKQFCREWKKCLPAPKDGTLCMDFLLRELERVVLQPRETDDESEQVFCFTDLWKRISGHPLIIDFGDPEMRIHKFGFGNKDNEAVLDALLKMADGIKHAEHTDWDSVFRFVVREEVRFKTALEKNLITKSMIPAALRYLRKHHPELIALLYLKQYEEL